MTTLYDQPRTPYARALECQHVSDSDKTELREAYGYLNLIALRRQINGLQDQLQRTLFVL